MRRFFDTHLHLRKPTREGLDELLRLLDTEPGLLGGLLVLNTAQEVDVIYHHLDLLPPSIVLVPYFQRGVRLPPEMITSGWYKIHPVLHKLDMHSLDQLAVDLGALAPRGVMVHCFPWGAELQYNVSLPYVIRLAQELPQSRILATHGGGYESWAFRAHAGAFRNVHFDFSMTLDYYEHSDVLAPLQRYMKFSPDRIHFGSDWPSGRIQMQWEEMLRLAAQVDILPQQLESMLLDNARTCWPEAVAAGLVLKENNA
jgi:hypothetical protein